MDQSSIDAAAKALGVDTEDRAAFAEVYTRLTEKKLGKAPSHRDLKSWKTCINTSRACCTVDEYVANNKDQLRDAIEKLAAATGTDGSKVEAAVMRRLRFCGVYGLQSGLTLEQALSKVTGELRDAAVSSSKNGAQGLVLEHGVYDKRHRALRDEAYPYIPSVSASSGARVIQAVAPESGALLGYVAMQGDYVDDVAVLPSMYGRSVGKALLAGAALCLTQTGDHQMFLDVRASNEPAINMYKGLGFQFSERGFPGFLDWHGGYECSAITADVASKLPPHADVSKLKN